jgi:mannitol operon repressor
VNQDDFAELSAFFGELQKETDRGLPLVGAALIDEKLLETLGAFLQAVKAADNLLTKPNAPLGTFAARLDACFALGLVDDHEYGEINLVRKIRNLFAHSRHGITFADERVQGLCASLTSELPSGGGDDPSARYRFTNSVVCLVLRLYYRPKWVELERRQPKVWVNPSEVRWRSLETEQPPEGVAFVAFGPNGARIVDQKA